MNSFANTMGREKRERQQRQERYVTIEICTKVMEFIRERKLHSGIKYNHTIISFVNKTENYRKILEKFSITDLQNIVQILLHILNDDDDENEDDNKNLLLTAIDQIKFMITHRASL